MTRMDRKITTVVFDLDGTLLDTLQDLADSVNYALRTHGLPERTTAEVRQMLGNGIRYLMEHAVPAGMAPEAFEPVFDTFRTYYVDHCLDKTQPYDGILPMLDCLRRRGLRMAIVSNKLDAAVQELNERFFARYVDSAVGESETVRRKPNPDGVLEGGFRHSAQRRRTLHHRVVGLPRRGFPAQRRCYVLCPPSGRRRRPDL